MPPAESNSNVRQGPEWFRPNVAFVVMIFGALIAFEIFNYSTTDHALSDLLGNLTFVGVPWSTMLALAFCGIDFAGIARLFTPEQGADEPKEIWYLFGAWLLAATMNAILTWWGVSMAVTGHVVSSSTVVDPGMITGAVPVFVAIMVWVIRILIIGTLSLAMDRLMHPEAHARAAGSYARHSAVPSGQQVRPGSIPSGLSSSGYTSTRPVAASRSIAASSHTPARPPVIEEDTAVLETSRSGRPEPTYHSMSARPQSTGGDRYRRS